MFLNLEFYLLYSDLAAKNVRRRSTCVAKRVFAVCHQVFTFETSEHFSTLLHSSNHCNSKLLSEG
jgi:hypothetical protein